MDKFTPTTAAAITGAGSGIGRAISLQLAEQGVRLALSDINAESLDETRQLCAEKSANLSTQVLNVADRDAVSRWANECQTNFGCINLLFNNAGVALGTGSLAETSIEDFEWLMGINFSGVLYGCKAFLPLLEDAEWGHIVNISSLFGLIAVANQSAYNSSKFAVRGLSEALRQELKESNSKVSCTSVHPGGIRTNIVRSARLKTNGAELNEAQRQQAQEDFDKVARTSAESAAKQILDAVQRDKPRLLIGMDAKIIDKIQRLLPSIYPKLLSKLIRTQRNE